MSDEVTNIPLSSLPFLKKSMAVMQAAEQKDVQKGDLQTMGNRTPRSAPAPKPQVQLESFPEHPQLLTDIPSKTASVVERPVSENAIMNSNLSPEIKKIMMENQIEDPASYVNPDVGITNNVRTDLMETEQPKKFISPEIPRVESHTNIQQPILDAEAIKQIVREEVRNVMSEAYAKTIRDKAIKDTVKVLKSKGLLK